MDTDKSGLLSEEEIEAAVEQLRDPQWRDALDTVEMSPQVFEDCLQYLVLQHHENSFDAIEGIDYTELLHSLAEMDEVHVEYVQKRCAATALTSCMFAGCASGRDLEAAATDAQVAGQGVA